MSELSLRHLPDANALETVRGEWTELHAACPDRHVMLDPLWVATWWKHFGAKKELHALLLSRGSEPVGFAPLMISRGREVFPNREAYVQIADDFRYIPAGRWRRIVPIRRLTFPLSISTGNLRSHFLLRDDDAEAVDRIAAWCREAAPRWDLLQLEGIPAVSGQLPLVRAGLERAGLHLGRAVGTRHFCYSPLAETFDEFLAAHSGKYRKRLRQECNLAERRAEGHGQLVVRAHRGSEVAQRMPELFDLERRSWKVRGERERRLHLQLDDRTRAFYAEVAERFAGRDRAQVLLMTVGDRTVAGLLSLEHGPTTAWIITYMASDLPFRPTIAPMWREFFRVSIEQGLREIDFNGKTDNVIKWADSELAYERVVAFNGGLRSRLLATVSDGARRATDALRQLGSASRPSST